MINQHQSPFLYFLIIITALTVISIILRCLQNEFVNPKEYYDLSKNGFIVLHNMLLTHQYSSLLKATETNQFDYIKNSIFNNPKIRNVINNTLGDEYIFQDYLWIIKKSRVVPCHRDLNGSMFNNIKHQTYNLLIYLKDMDKNLDIIMGSHKNASNVYLTDYTKSIKCQVGDALLFNTNLIHAGSVNKKIDNCRLQLKLCHRDDYNKLNYYNGVNRSLEDDDWSNVGKQMYKYLTCQFPIITNTINKYNNKKNIPYRVG